MLASRREVMKAKALEVLGESAAKNAERIEGIEAILERIEAKVDRLLEYEAPVAAPAARKKVEGS